MTRPKALLPTLPREAWVLLGGDALSALGSGLTLPFLLVYLHQVRGIGVGVAALVLSTVAVAGLIGNPLGGWLSDRFGSRRAVMAGLAVNAAGVFGLVFVDEAWHAFAAAAVVGLGAGVLWPAEDALLATVVAPAQRASIFSLHHAVLNAGFGAGGLTAALIVDLSSPASFELLYLVDALSFLAFLAVLLALRRIGTRPEAAPPKEERTGYRQVVADRMFLRVWALTALLVTIGYAQYHAAFPAFATGEAGLGASGLSIAFAANTLAVVGFQLVTLHATAGWRRSRAIALVGAFWAAGWAVTLLAGETGGVAIVAVFAFAMVLLAVGETLVAATVPALVNDLAPDHLRGRYNGAYTLAWTSGFIAGPAVAGVLLAGGHARGLLLALVALSAVAALAALRLERRLPAHVNGVGPARQAQPIPDLVPAT